MASWNPALRPDSAHPSSSPLESKPAAPPTASWNPAFRPNSSHSPSLLDTNFSSSSAPPPSPASPPSYTSPSPPAAQPPSYTASPSHAETETAARDVRSQVPFLHDEKTDAKVPADAVVESADGGEGGDLEAGPVVAKDKGMMARARGGFGMLCYVVVLCLTLGMFGCYSYAV